MHSLTQILATLAAKGDAYRATAGEDWAQGRTLFGGLIAALANAAMRKSVGHDRPLRALQIAYIGPNTPGDVDFEPRILRSGKAVTLAACTVRSAGEVSATVTAMYGGARESALKIAIEPYDLAVQPSDVTDVPARFGLPTFTQHYRQRWARGEAPFTGAASTPMSVYVNYRADAARTTTEAHALALMDAIPSPALAALKTPSPSSTLSWTLEILDHRFEFGIDEWWRLDADVDAAAEGYVAHTSHVINPARRVAAISRQVVVVYG